MRFDRRLSLSHALVLALFAVSGARGFQLFKRRDVAPTRDATPTNEITRTLSAVQEFVRNFDVCAPTVENTGADEAVTHSEDDAKWPLSQLFSLSSFLDRMAIDVVETNDTITFTADVPGIDASKGELIVEVIENVLTISGERTEDVECDHATCDSTVHKRERHFGKFRNRFALPPHAMIDQITAEVNKGVLKVIVPKAAAGDPVKIAVVETTT